MMFWVFRNVFGTPRRCCQPQNTFWIRLWLIMENENVMGHWSYIFYSLWRIFVILASKIALKGVSSLINHTSFPCKSYYFSKFYQKHVNGHFLNLKSLIRLSQVIPIDVLWLDYPYWPIVSILRIQILEILMIFCHSPADTATNKKIIWSGVY